jgi:CRP-like cAMP-binding protein
VIPLKEPQNNGALMSKRKQNSLLASLSAKELTAISSALEPVQLPKNLSLFAADKQNDFVYFPVDAVISFIGDTGQGGTIEVWAVGREGVAGISAILGGTNLFRSIVVVPGTALKARVSPFRRHFNECGRFHDVALSYYHSLLGQISHLGICNNSHPLTRRFSRWLLTMEDRAGTKELKFTQELIASMLGTRRATISVAAAELQSAGLISYTPGSITIKSRSGLKKMACGCYKVISPEQK